MTHWAVKRWAMPAGALGAAIASLGWLAYRPTPADGAAAAVYATVGVAAARPASTAGVGKPASPPAPGRDTPAVRAAAGSAAPAATPARPPRDRGAALATLDFNLVRERVGPPARAVDAFATRRWEVAPPPPPAPAPPPPPPPPQAPPLPFKYMGMLQESADRTVFYLLHGERLIVAAPNDMVGPQHRFDGLAAGQLRFTYLPLDQRQSLAIGGLP